MERHKRTRNGKKKYHYTVCDKSFSQSAHVKTHMRSLTGEKPYGEKESKCTVSTNGDPTYKDKPSVVKKPLSSKARAIKKYPVLSHDIKRRRRKKETKENTIIGNVKKVSTNKFTKLMDSKKTESAKVNLSQIAGISPLTKTSSLQETLAEIPELSCQPKRKYKRSHAAQLEQLWTRGCVDLQTPNSVLVNTNLKTLLNRDTFLTLPVHCRNILLKLLPSCDQISKRNKAEISTVTLTNEFFNQSCYEWTARLAEGEFTNETQQRIKIEQEKMHAKMDAWKLAHFEAFYGDKFEDNVDSKVFDNDSNLMVDNESVCSQVSGLSSNSEVEVCTLQEALCVEGILSKKILKLDTVSSSNFAPPRVASMHTNDSKLNKIPIVKLDRLDISSLEDSRKMAADASMKRCSKSEISTTPYKRAYKVNLSQSLQNQPPVLVTNVITKSLMEAQGRESNAQIEKSGTQTMCATSVERMPTNILTNICNNDQQRESNPPATSSQSQNQTRPFELVAQSGSGTQVKLYTYKITIPSPAVGKPGATCRFKPDSAGNVSAKHHRDSNPTTGISSGVSTPVSSVQMMPPPGVHFFFSTPNQVCYTVNPTKLSGGWGGKPLIVFLPLAAKKPN